MRPNFFILTLVFVWPLFSSSQETSLISENSPLERESLKWNFDIRYRLEGKTDQSISQVTDNNSFLMARLGFVTQLDKQFKVALRLATGTGSPSSTNQTLGSDGLLGGKAFNLDRAYIQWLVTPSVSAFAGKIKNILYRPGHSQMQWDSDYNPEGFAVQYEKEFSESYGLAVRAVNYNIDTTTNEATYPTMFGLQIQGHYFSTNVDANITLDGIQYLDLDSRPGYGSVGTNTLSGGAYIHDYSPVGGGFDVTFKHWLKPIQIFADYAENGLVDSDNVAYQAGFRYGNAEQVYDWDFKALFKEIGKDAALDLFPDASFMGGGTDNRGSMLKLGYKSSNASIVHLVYYGGERYISNESQKSDYEAWQGQITLRY